MFNPLENRNKSIKLSSLILFLGLTMGVIAFFFLTGFKDFDFSKLFDISYIIKGTPGASFKFYKEFIGFFGLLFFTSISIKIVLIFKKNKVLKKLLNKIKTLFFTVSILGFLYLFFRSQNIYFFSSRFFLLSIFLIMVVWSFYIVFLVIRKFPSDFNNYKKQELIKKYLPKKNKKK